MTEKTTPLAMPLVSVLMASYNHGAFIRQAIQSVIDQRCDFAFELVISDDISSDDTPAIIAEMAAAHPDIIRIVSPPDHLGLGSNFRHTYMQCRGKYVAMLDSDDFWLGRDKLAIQVAVMEASPDCTLSFHNAVLWKEWNQTSRMKLAKIVPDFRGGDYFVRHNPITTMTAMFRRIVDQRVLDSLLGLDLQDLPLWVWLADQGTVKCLPDLFGFYRIHQKGTYAKSSNLSRLQSKYECLRRNRDFVTPQTQRVMDYEFTKMLLILAMRKLLQQRNVSAARADWREARNSARRGSVGIVTFFGMTCSAGWEGFRFALAKVFGG